MRALILFVILFLSACNSPRNNRVLEGGIQSELETLVFSTAPYSIRVQWLEGPFGTSTKKSVLQVVVYDANGNLSSIKNDIGFYSWMPSMGHPMEDAGYFEEVSEGVYLNSHIKFNMPGDWEHSIMLMDSNFEVLEEVRWEELL